MNRQKGGKEGQVLSDCEIAGRGCSQPRHRSWPSQSTEKQTLERSFLPRQGARRCDGRGHRQQRTCQQLRAGCLTSGAAIRQAPTLHPPAALTWLLEMHLPVPSRLMETLMLVSLVSRLTVATRPTGSAAKERRWCKLDGWEAASRQRLGLRACPATSVLPEAYHAGSPAVPFADTASAAA